MQMNFLFFRVLMACEIGLSEIACPAIPSHTDFVNDRQVFFCLRDVIVTKRIWELYKDRRKNLKVWLLLFKWEELEYEAKENINIWIMITKRMHNHCNENQQQQNLDFEYAVYEVGEKITLDISYSFNISINWEVVCKHFYVMKKIWGTRKCSQGENDILACNLRIKLPCAGRKSLNLHHITQIKWI